MRCEECRQEPDVEAHATSWVAYLVDLADDPDEPEVIAPTALRASSVGARIGRNAHRLSLDAVASAAQRDDVAGARTRPLPTGHPARGQLFHAELAAKSWASRSRLPNACE
jgi:hypothetical protein